MPRSVGLIAAALVVLCGCGPKGPKGPEGKAEAAIDVVLDAWVRGEPADKFADAAGAIQAADPDWKAGYRLLSFLTVESKPIADKAGAVRCKVALSLQDRAGKKEDKEVTYDVQVGDKTVIARVPR